MNFFDHKDLGNHLLQLCPKVVKHPVYIRLLEKISSSSSSSSSNGGSCSCSGGGGSSSSYSGRCSVSCCCSGGGSSSSSSSSNNITLVKEQFGFRAKISTEVAPYSFIAEIFDCINHGILLSKLRNYGTTGTFYSLMTSYIRVVI